MPRKASPGPAPPTPRRAGRVRTRRSCRAGCRGSPSSASRLTSCRPRPPSSVSRARRRRGCDQVGVPDLAHQRAVQQQAQPDVAAAVPQRVRHQLADQQLGGVDQVVQAPRPAAGRGPARGPWRPTCRLGRQASSRRPRRPAGRAPGPSAARRRPRRGGCSGSVSTWSQASSSGSEARSRASRKASQALVQLCRARLHQAVGVEGEQRAVREVDLDLLERLAADPQRDAVRHVQHQRVVARLHHAPAAGGRRWRWSPAG